MLGLGRARTKIAIRYDRDFPYTLLSSVEPIEQSTEKTSWLLATESSVLNICRMLWGQSRNAVGAHQKMRAISAR